MITIQDALKNRHAVRSYLDKEINPKTLSELTAEVAACNTESGLNIQLVTHEPRAFSGFVARYGKFSGVKNYIALIGKPEANLQEKAGYFGQRLVLKVQQLGLNSCWVGASYSKGKCGVTINKDEKLVCVIAIGYGVTQGVPHKTKPMETLYQVDSGESPMPEWFRKGMEAAMLAPTAMNQQKFLFTLTKNGVQAQATGKGYGYAQIDLGIAKYHFEVGAGKENFNWVDG